MCNVQSQKVAYDAASSKMREGKTLNLFISVSFFLFPRSSAGLSQATHDDTMHFRRKINYAHFPTIFLFAGESWRAKKT